MRLVTKCAFALSALLLAWPRNATCQDDPQLRVLVDYLPSLVYYRERISLRIRVENPWSSDATCTLHVDLDPPPAPPSPPLSATVALPGRQSVQTGFELEAKGWSTARVWYEFEGDTGEVVNIRRFDEGGDIPRLRAQGERLYVEDTYDSVVLALEQRTSQPDREWYLWKRFAERLGDGALPAGVVLLTARLWDGDDEASPYLRNVRENAGTWVDATVLPGESAQGVLHPVLADLADAIEALSGGRRAELVVWVTACDDPRRATPKRIYRKAADFLMNWARQRGASRLAVLFVPEPAVPGDRRSLYAEELRAAARAYRGTYERIDGVAETEYWVSPSAVESRTLMRYPNSEGLRAVAEAVLERIKR